MGDYVAIIGIVVSVLVSLGTILVGVIGYLIVSRLNGIEASVGHIPALQQEMVAMKVKVDQHGDKQEEFGEGLEEVSQRLMAVEKHISNTERIAVLERDVREIDRLRPIVHALQTDVQIILHNAKFVELMGLEVPKG